MWPSAASLGLDTGNVSSCSKAPHSSCTGVGELVLLSMSPPLLSLLRVSRGRALWACPPNSVLPTGEAFPFPVLKLQVHGWRGVGTLGTCPPLTHHGSAAASSSHFSSLFLEGKFVCGKEGEKLFKNYKGTPWPQRFCCVC